jgi:hypothetical protein
MDVDDPMDMELNKTQMQLHHDELKELLKVNSIKCIDHMRILLKESLQFDILLCRMVYMPFV